MEALPPADGPDWPARIVAGKGVLLEGLEVVLIVAALAGGSQGAAPALAGAALAVLVVAAIGLVVHRPLARRARVAAQVRGRRDADELRRVLPRRGARRRLAGRGRGAALRRRGHAARVSQVHVRRLAQA